MKKFLFSLLFACLSFSVFAQRGETVTQITYPKLTEVGEEYVDETNGIELNFRAFLGEVTFYLYNNNRDRVYIEWENAKFQSSRVVFGDDSRITMSRTKADEAVMGNSFSERKSIFPQSYVSSDYVRPLYDTEKLREGGKSTFTAVIPVRFADGRIVDYKVFFDVFYRNKADYSSLKIGMKKNEVKAIMDKPNSTISRDKQLIWIYTNNVHLIFMNNKLTEIVPYKPKE